MKEQLKQLNLVVSEIAESSGEKKLNINKMEKALC